MKEIEKLLNLGKDYNVDKYEDAKVQFLNWIDYIVNSFIDEKYSNGFTEGLNNKIKVIKRVGFGYKNFDFFRLRLLYILNSKK